MRRCFSGATSLPAAGYKEVIIGPAGRATRAGRRLSIELALVDRLLADTAEGADALPLLALTLERLYHDFGDDGNMTVAEYEAMGGTAQIVQTEVDKLLAADPEQRQAQLDVLHDAFIPWLATINPDSDQAMRRLARPGVASEDECPPSDDGDLDQLQVGQLVSGGGLGGVGIAKPMLRPDTLRPLMFR